MSGSYPVAIGCAEGDWLVVEQTGQVVFLPFDAASAKTERM
jgi:hypothetical protein